MRHIVGYAVSDSAFSGQQQLQGKSEGRDRPRTHCRVSGVTTTFKYESEAMFTLSATHSDRAT